MNFIPIWLRTKWLEALILILLVVSCLSLATSFSTFQLIRRMNKPELMIDQVYLRVNEDNGAQFLVMDYRNAGHARMDWLRLATGLVKDDLSVQNTVLTVRSNGLPPGGTAQVANQINAATAMLALCAAWLDEGHQLSVAHWTYSLATEQLDPKHRRYVDASAREQALVRDLNLCKAAPGATP